MIKLEMPEHIMQLKNGKNNYEFYIGSSEGLVRLYDVWYGKYVS